MEFLVHIINRIKVFIIDFITREVREIVSPISIEGINGQFVGDYRLATEFNDATRPENFTPSTAIISNGVAIWQINVPEYIRKKLIDMTLKIETIRTHGLLHSRIYRKSASIFLNDKLLDKIYLVKRHPNGEDYGVDSRRPFPVFRYIDRNKEIQKIKIEIENDSYWDIDRVTLEPIILNKQIKPWITIIIGAIISSTIGTVLNRSVLGNQ